ncbi:MAG: hypothetical protein ACRCUY_00420 [Thermoguttaceae bacterium]
MKHIVFSAFVILVLFTTVVGCSQKIKYQKINGTVSVDGVPIERGVIQFDKDGGDEPSGGGKIIAGRFTADAVAGSNTVRVSGEAKSDKPIPDPVNVGKFLDHAEVTDSKVHWDESQTVIEITPKQQTYEINLPRLPDNKLQK